MEPTSPNFLEPPFRVSKNFRCPPSISSSPPLAILNELSLETFKYLRIVLDSNISWSSHVDYLCNKISSRIGILKRIMPCLTLPSAQTVYKSTIQPLVHYCGVVWDAESETSSLRLQRLIVEYFLMGDLNCDLQSKDNSNVKALLNITDIYGLEQLINEPTRITPSTSTLIDQIFSIRPENVY